MKIADWYLSERNLTIPLTDPALLNVDAGKLRILFDPPISFSQTIQGLVIVEGKRQQVDVEVGPRLIIRDHSGEVPNPKAHMGLLAHQVLSALGEPAYRSYGFNYLATFRIENISKPGDILKSFVVGANTLVPDLADDVVGAGFRLFYRRGSDLFTLWLGLQKADDEKIAAQLNVHRQDQQLPTAEGLYRDFDEAYSSFLTTVKRLLKGD